LRALADQVVADRGLGRQFHERGVPALDLDLGEQRGEELRGKLGVERQPRRGKRVGELGRVVPARRRDGDEPPGSEHAVGFGKCRRGVGQVVEHVEQGDGAEPPVRERKRGRVRQLVTKGAAGMAAIIAVDDVHKTYEELVAKGVEFTEEPTERFYGTDCGLRDPFGNELRIGTPKEGPFEVPDPSELARN
jgi:Glyoxalase/Bleomycin resistance protein/Dioxygenase superfamily